MSIPSVTPPVVNETTTPQQPQAKLPSSGQQSSQSASAVIQNDNQTSPDAPNPVRSLIKIVILTLFLTAAFVLALYVKPYITQYLPRNQ